MDAKDKAIQLVKKYKEYFYGYGLEKDERHGNAKKCAIIAVDEMLFESGYMSAIATKPIELEFADDRVKYLKSVKTEIEKL